MYVYGGFVHVTVVTMMFNGLLTFGDSDTSDYGKQNASRCKLCSAGGDLEYYRKQLEAANRMLKEKEETIRFQEASLALAEARATELAAKRDARAHTRCPPAPVTPNFDNQAVIRTLQEKLSIIEDLYRESFYESIEQEQLVSLLRRAVQDLRARDDAHVHRLQNAVNAQKCELDRCQDIAAEVEVLKSEISNFLHGSNNDSGVWEEPTSPAQFAEDLQEISKALCSLREILAGPCNCGLEKENKELKQLNAKMAMTIGDLQGQISDLTTSLEDQTKKGEHYLSQLQLRKLELQTSKDQIEDLAVKLQESAAASEKLKKQLQQTEELVRTKCAEVTQLQQQCAQLAAERTAARQDAAAVCSDVLTDRLQQFDSQRPADLDASSKERECCNRDASYGATLATLQGRLAAARAAGAALCEDAWRAVAGVRAWSRRVREHNMALKEKIKLQEKLIQKLQEQLGYQEIPERSRPCGAESLCRRKPRVCLKKAPCSRPEREFTSAALLVSGARRPPAGPTCGAGIGACSSSGSSAGCVSTTELRSMRKVPVAVSAHEAASQASSSRRCSCSGEDPCIESILERLQSAQMALKQRQGSWRRDRPPPC